MHLFGHGGDSFSHKWDAAATDHNNSVKLALSGHPFKAEKASFESTGDFFSHDPHSHVSEGDRGGTLYHMGEEGVRI
jgi:hypothetical protein